jgi:F0F1-type ATP synthase membrane subunit c/vacuolar-type H+-ATPase subunit K
MYGHAKITSTLNEENIFDMIFTCVAIVTTAGFITLVIAIPFLFVI